MFGKFLLFSALLPIIWAGSNSNSLASKHERKFAAAFMELFEAQGYDGVKNVYFSEDFERLTSSKRVWNRTRYVGHLKSRFKTKLPTFFAEKNRKAYFETGKNGGEKYLIVEVTPEIGQKKTLQLRRNRAVFGGYQIRRIIFGA